MSRTLSWIVCVVACLGSAVAAGAQEPLPIIDVHVHALPVNGQGPPPVAICAPMAYLPTATTGSAYPKAWQEPACDDPIWSPDTDAALMSGTIEVMNRLNVYGVLSGTPARVTEWVEAAPSGRFIRGLGFNLGMGISPDSLRALHDSGLVSVLAEVTNQYLGIAPDDPRMDPYWALAEELDLPVGIHIGTGPPGAIYLGFSEYRAKLHSVLPLEDVLVRHPDLRVYIMHAGYPMLDDLLALLFAHPQAYVGIGAIVHAMPRAAFYHYLRTIVEYGFANRVMFGSDQMVWPETMEQGVESIEQAPFLSEEQKRDILYNNAARFFRLTPEEIAAHHRP